MRAMRTFILFVALVAAAVTSQSAAGTVDASHGGVTYLVEGSPARPFIYVVWHSTDRDGFCDASLVGAVSLHPHLDMPVDFLIDGGDGVIIETSGSGGGLPANPRGAAAVRTFSTARNALSAAPVRAFPPSRPGVSDECQAWVKVAQSIPGPLNILVVGHTPEGDLATDVLIDSRQRETRTLNFRWTLVTWDGTDGVDPATALGDQLRPQVTALYGWDADAQRWLGYFGPGAPAGANDLSALRTGEAYWVAIRGPNPASWSPR